ncbi:MAG: stage sporulation protein [Firmicutes bacterium]|nr:stage sporulation protein [Bacillota bacterium]
MTNTAIYQDISARTGGDIYIGVVGPARTGKSTFIKRFMETMVLPNMENTYRRDRARDELPQSGSGRTIMTAEPKFVPEEAVEISIEGGGSCSVRLIDCVGYMVPGAVGQLEDDMPRMVRTPWFAEEIPMAQAAEIGTRKVIAEHSTIGIVVTTDGSITEIPREDYIEAEERVINELKELGKPFVLLLNSAHPNADRTQILARQLEEAHGVSCIPINCLELNQKAVSDIIQEVLYEFPMEELELFLPEWVDALEYEHPIKKSVYHAIRNAMGALGKIRDVDSVMDKVAECDLVSQAKISKLQLGTGHCEARIEMPRTLFYDTMTEQTGFPIRNDGELLLLLTEMAKLKGEYEKVSTALAEVRATGYGIVVPTADELVLEEPEIVKQGGRYGVKLKAAAPSIHMIRADIQAEVSPIVGNEKQSEDMLHFLLSEFEEDPAKIWQSNIFGRSFHELINEDLSGKLKRMPEEARQKMQEALERIINEGSGGLICIIL